jgi:hypothetical protein
MPSLTSKETPSGCVVAQAAFDHKERRAAKARHMAEMASRRATVKATNLAAQQLAVKLSNKALQACSEALAAQKKLCKPTTAPTALPMTAAPTFLSLPWVDKVVSKKAPCNRDWVKIAEQQVYQISKEMLLARYKLSSLIKQEAAAARSAHQLDLKVKDQQCDF